jgi:hypothetical protein
MNIINVSLAILLTAVVFIVLTPNRWTNARVPKYNKHKESTTEHGELMDAIRKTRQ